jgi:hypothetical protein
MSVPAHQRTLQGLERQLHSWLYNQAYPKTICNNAFATTPTLSMCQPSKEILSLEKQEASLDRLKNLKMELEKAENFRHVRKCDYVMGL